MRGGGGRSGPARTRGWRCGTSRRETRRWPGGSARWLRDSGVPGTLAELRAAAYLARLSGRGLANLLPGGDGSSSAGSGGPASGGGGRWRGGAIHLTMPLAALAGLTDSPGEVAGYGPADAATCRQLAGRLGSDPATRWCLTLTSAGGHAAGHACARRGSGPRPGQPVLAWAAGLRDKLQLLPAGTCDHSSQSPGYVWPASLRHLIEIRQPTCAAPGCRRPAAACDIDHTIPFENGGPTCACNASPLCRRHHRCKQTPGWHLSQGPPGIMTWQLPSGREYETSGPPYLEYPPYLE
jgi:hypothetical protein